MSWSWASRLSLQLDGVTRGLSGSTLSCVVLDSLQKLLSTLRVLNVLNPHVHSLLDASATNNLVDHDTDGGFSNVEDDTGLTLVDLVRHTLLDRTVGLDVDNVTNFVDLQIGRQWNSTMSSEVTLEHVTSTRSVTVPISNMLVFRT